MSMWGNKVGARPPRKNWIQHNKDKTEADRATDARIYGPLLEHVKLLRQRGYVVFRCALSKQRYYLDYRAVTAAELVAKADTVRRLAAGAAQA